MSPARCPSCGAVVRDDDLSCRQCNHSLLVNVVAESAIGEEVARRAARELAGLGSTTERAAHQRLEQAPGPVLVRVDRGTGQAHRAVLVGLGIATHLAPAPPARHDRDLEILTAEESWWAGRGWVWLVPALAVVIAAVVGLGWVADQMGPEGAGRARPDALQQAEAGLLSIETGPSSLERLVRASGFAVSNELVITEALIGAAEGDSYLVNGSPSPAVWIDEWLGLAAVQAPGQAKRFELGDATSLELGDTLLLPGTAVRHATVTRPAVDIMGLALVELDVTPLGRGGGAPVLDASGRVVGVLSSTHSREGHGAFAVPINYLTSGPEPVLPAVGRGRGSWPGWLAAVGLPPQRRAERLAAELARPCLLSAQLQPDGITVATVGALSSRAPAPGRLSFRLESGPEPPGFWAPVPRWRPTALDDAGPVPPQARWLHRNGHFLFYFTAEVPIEVVCTGCAVTGADLVLIDGRPGHSRTTIEPAVRRSRRSAESRRWQRPPLPTPTPSPW